MVKSVVNFVDRSVCGCSCVPAVASDQRLSADHSWPLLTSCVPVVASGKAERGGELRQGKARGGYENANETHETCTVV